MRGRHFLVEANVVAEGGDEDGGEVGSVAVDGGFEARDVVEDVVIDMGAVFGGDAGEGGRGPGHGAVVGATGDEDFAVPGAGAGEGDGHGGGVGAVFGTGPISVGMVSTRSSASSTMDSDRPVLAVAEGSLAGGGGFDLGVMVAEQDGAPGAHEVNVFVAVDVADAAALGGGEELG
jgi:hypothetical protein